MDTLMAYQCLDMACNHSNIIGTTVMVFLSNASNTCNSEKATQTGLYIMTTRPV